MCLVRICWSDVREGSKVCLKRLGVRWCVVIVLTHLYLILILGIVEVMLLFMFVVVVVGVIFGDRLPRYMIVHLEKTRAAWEEEQLGDDPCAENPTVAMERVPKKGYRRAACKVAMKAISKVGLLDKTKANSMIYQRVCLDIMDTMRMRYMDRLHVLPLAVLACLERPDDVEEVSRVVSSVCSAGAVY